MFEIDQKLCNSYEYWEKELSSSVTQKSAYTVGINDVLRAHYLLCDFFLYEGEAIATPGPRDINLFLSAIDRQTTGFGKVQKWNDLFHITATLFYEIINNHPFHDGN